VSNHIIYLLQSGDDGPVMLGITAAGAKPGAVRSHVRKLQAGNPDTINIAKLINGDPLLERRLHVRFADRQVRGDWYEASILNDLPADLDYRNDEDRRHAADGLRDLAETAQAAAAGLAALAEGGE
jgi:hypothetical protein